jgi:hypothetical protein
MRGWRALAGPEQDVIFRQQYSRGVCLRVLQRTM